MNPTGVPIPVLWDEDGPAVSLLDQTLLPGREERVRLETAEEVAEAIASLRVRGAPAIGIAAAFGLALGMARWLEHEEAPGSAEAETQVENLTRLLLDTRPTGRNLATALDRGAAAFQGALPGGVCAAVEALQTAAQALAEEDRRMCLAIGEAGATLIPAGGASVLTHCNAGALATGGIGTALAPLYVAHGAGVPLRVFADETRPVLQGARLTAWELSRAGLDVTVIADSMAGSLMAAGDVDLVIVGADRIAANGDVANKIGTYPLAVLAAHHAIPFYVAAPSTTLDLTLESGRAIPIEERGEAELRGESGAETVPEGAAVWNPAFDVTPAALVTAIVTEAGVVRPPYGPTLRAASRRGT